VEWGAPDPKAKVKFAELDANKDGFLTAAELRAVAATLHPGEMDFAHSQAEHLIEQADGDSDGKLSLDEMHTNQYVFYSTAFGSSYDGDYHYEL